MVFPVLEKNAAKTRESKQAFVGQPRNACLGNASVGSCMADGAPFEMTRIGFSNQIRCNLKALRYISHPAVNFPG